MSAYNTEQYIEQAIKSVIKQNIGFKNVQLIIINDGSTDNTKNTIESFALKYPHNIKLINQENKGPSNARNTGLKYAEGKYINFLDSDDILYKNALKKVYEFFENHYEETDLVSIPIYFFGAINEEHYLNYKYKKGTRIIDLEKEWDTPQKSISSSFIKNETIKTGLLFDERIRYSEDLKLIQKILSKKQTMGVVSDTKYLYRRRNNNKNKSIIENSIYDENWYIPCAKYAYLETMEQYRTENKKIPMFVQNTILSDIQWRIIDDNTENDFLDQSKEKEYKKILKKIINHIDNKIILDQKYLDSIQKYSIIKEKQKKSKEQLKDKTQLYLNNLKIFDYSIDTKIEIDFLEVLNDKCLIEGRLYTINDNNNYNIIVFNKNRRKSKKMKLFKYKDNIICEKYSKIYSFEIKFDYKYNKEYEIRIKINNNEIKPKNIIFGRYVCFSNVYKHMFINNQENLVLYKQGAIIFKKKSIKNTIANNLLYYLDLLEAKDKNKNINKASYKSLLIRFLVIVSKTLKRKQIWIFRDRIKYADDNGLVLYDYIRNNHKEIQPYFVISKKSKDYLSGKVKGNVIDPLSMKYKILYLISDYILSSSADDDAVRPFKGHYEPYKDLEKPIKRVFLQHGIILHDLSRWLNKYEMNFYGFICSSEKEKESLLKNDYAYHKKNIWLTGLARYDQLSNKKEKTIIIAPTWRQYLLGEKEDDDHRELKTNYLYSNYYKTYNSLLNNKKLSILLKENGYKLVFFSHPTLKEYSCLFENKHNYLIDPDIPYKEVLAKGSLLITDYSSIMFDFAYLQKPIIYYQFDKKEFYKKHRVCKKGYFIYEKDGFGEVFKTEKKLIEKIESYLKNNCINEAKYINKSNRFFKYKDQGNCKRIYENIAKMEKTKQKSI